MHFGIISPPVSGHLHPFGALGRELIARGHRVTVFHMADLAPRVRSEKLEFVTIGAHDHPPGSLELSLAQLARLQGLAALRFTIAAVCRTTEMMARDAPAAIRAAAIDCLLADQTEPIGGALADHLRLPFATICNALLLHEEPGLPAALYQLALPGEPLATSSCQKLAGVSPVGAGHASRARSGEPLPPRLDPRTLFTRSGQPLSVPANQPAARLFRLPPPPAPASFPLRRPAPRGRRLRGASPWDQLNGKPLIYASLGTLQNRKGRLFHQFCQACAGLPVQLVVSHANGLDEKTINTFAGNPIVVSYSPQLQVLSRAQLTLTHAGLNTVLDALSQGVPLVAIPLTYEQPAIASRIKWAKVGEVLSPARLSVQELRRKITLVLDSGQYYDNANRLAKTISTAGGVKSAVNLIESTYGIA